jgi:hypothetical protein
MNHIQRLVRSVHLAGLLTAVGLCPEAIAAQASPAAGAPLFVLDLAGTPVGEIPTSIELRKGILEVALKNGIPMLKASAASEFLITLPQGQVLPRDFTLEFELVPKACQGCAPQDLSFEGMRDINQGGGSAHVLWEADGHLAVIGGGGGTYSALMPEELWTALPGVLTRVVVVIEGTTIRLYTNGRRLYTLSSRRFARGDVLRVFLGGQDDGADAVHLAALRLTAGALSPAQFATNSSALSGGSLASGAMGTPTAVGSSTTVRGTAAGAPVPTSVNVPTGPGAAAGPVPPRTPSPAAATAPAPIAAAAGAVPSAFAVTVTLGGGGPLVTWPPVPAATGYSVSRWKADDLSCCNTSSGRMWAAMSPWQDSPLPMSGTYEYVVAALTPTGVLRGVAQFGFRMPGGAPTAPPPTPVVAQPAATPTATATPMPPPVVVLPAASQTATATPMAAVGKYEISIESVKVNSAAVDDLIHGDGLQNEFYLTAFVRTKDKTGNVLSEASHKSATHGDITNWPPPARVRAGSGSPNGGVFGGDLISPIWDQPNAASQGWTRFVLWSGSLTAGMETVDVVPAIWESDNIWLRGRSYDDLLRQVGYSVLDLNALTTYGDISNVMLATEHHSTGVGVAPYIGFHIMTPENRPIGIAKMRDPLNDAARWFPFAISVNHTVAEAALSGAYGPPGLIPIRFVDHKLLSKDTFTHPDLGMGDYVMNIRITRLP